MWTLGQSVEPDESNVRNESYIVLFRHQRVHYDIFGAPSVPTTFLQRQVHVWFCYCASIFGEMVWRKFLDRKKGISSAQSCMVFHVVVEVVALPLLPLLFLMYYCLIAAAVADVCSRSSSTQEELLHSKPATGFQHHNITSLHSFWASTKVKNTLFNSI